MLDGQLSQLSSEVERLFDDARNRARRELADQLNQAVRRLRQSDSLDTLTATLLDAALSFCAGAALFRISGSIAHGEKIRGVAPEAALEFVRLELPFSQAAALGGAVESRDPVIAVTTPSEVSADMMSLAGHPADGRAYLFPLVVEDKVPVLLYCWGATSSPALEMLAQVAAAVWNSLVVPEPQEFVQIAAAPAPQAEAEPMQAPAPVAPPQSAWEQLSSDDQAIHLRAQRYARVQVAEMRLHEPAAVQSGRTQKKLYDTLRPRIDTARATFRQNYFAPCSNMVDYLHVELVRSLAHEDQDLLGQDYPGPLV